MDGNIWWWLTPIILLPVFFAMGWFAARVDMKAVLKQAKSVPAAFYASLDALVDRNLGSAARHLADMTDLLPAGDNAYELHLTLGKLYRQRGENDKAIRLHQALLEAPETVGEKRNQVLFELGQDYQSAGLVDRAEQIFLGLQQGNMAAQARNRPIPLRAGAGRLV